MFGDFFSKLIAAPIRLANVPIAIMEEVAGDIGAADQVERIARRVEKTVKGEDEE
jgi:hypothetical protein